LTVCLNPTLQKTLLLSELREGEVNRSSEYHLDASGKGVNVTRVLSQLGVEARHLTHAGGRNRDLFLSLCGADGLSVAAPDSGSEIRTCYTLLDRSKNAVTEIVEEPLRVSPETEAEVRSEFEKLIPRAGCLILSGTRAPGYSPDLYADFTRTAKAAGVRVVLDIRGPDLIGALKFGPDIIKPNFAEFAATFITGVMGREAEQDMEILESAGMKMREIYLSHGSICILTRGGLPAAAFDGREIFYSQPRAVEPVNTIGCGDAFTAGFAAAWEAAGFPGPESGDFPGLFRKALEEGHRCAALNARLVRPGRIR
jgi:fructose-1-phosphate kinase PfkB-like protein